MRLSTSKPDMSGKRKIQDYAVARLPAHQCQPRFARVRSHDVDVVVSQQLTHAQLFGAIVLDDEQALAAGRREILDARQRVGERLGRRGFRDEREGAAGEAMLPGLVGRDELHRNVSCQRVLLELVEHRPAEHVRKKDVERHGGREELFGERQRLISTVRHEDLETGTARDVDEEPGIVRVVLDDEQRQVPWDHFVAVVENHLRRALDANGRRRGSRRPPDPPIHPTAGGRRAAVPERAGTA